MSIHFKRIIYNHLYEAMAESREAWQPAGLVDSELEAWNRVYNEIKEELSQRAEGTCWTKANARKKGPRRVRILEAAFPGSDEAEDIASRGQTGEARALDWAGCWEVLLDDGGRTQVTTEEIEFLEEP